MKREDAQFAIRYLQHSIPSLYSYAKFYNISVAKLKGRLKRSLDYLSLHSAWPLLPYQKPLIAVADAMVQCVRGKFYTFYFILIRKVDEKEAYIVRPYLRQGTETASGWYEAFELLPEATHDSIVALVCDGHRGLISYVQRHDWLIQRCHFHLIARIQSRRSKWRFSRHHQEGKLLYELIIQVLNNPDEDKIRPLLLRLKERALYANSRELKTYLLGFTKYYRDYRTFLYHPHLHLPRTNNSVESLIGELRNLLHRARGFRTLESLEKWIHAYLKNKRKSKCNGFNFQPN